MWREKEREREMREKERRRKGRDVEGEREMRGEAFGVGRETRSPVTTPLPPDENATPSMVLRNREQRRLLAASILLAAAPPPPRQQRRIHPQSAGYRTLRFDPAACSHRHLLAGGRTTPEFYGMPPLLRRRTR